MRVSLACCAVTVAECPEAFFPEGTPWPESAVNQMVTCLQGHEANRPYCKCLAKRVARKVSLATIVRVGAGEPEAKKEVQAVVKEYAPECMERQEHQPAPHVHRRQGEK